MSIQTNTHAIDGAQEYTLLVSERDSNNRAIVQYGLDGPILTTDYDSLIEYAAKLVLLFGRAKIYTIAMVTPITPCNV